MTSLEKQQYIIHVINERKEYAGISNAELAKRIGISKSRIGYVLRNERKIYGSELVLLCMYFGISMNEIVGPTERSVLQAHNTRALEEKGKY